MRHSHQAVCEETLPDDKKMHCGAKRMLLVLFRSLPHEKEHSLAVAPITPKCLPFPAFRFV